MSIIPTDIKLMAIKYSGVGDPHVYLASYQVNMSIVETDSVVMCRLECTTFIMPDLWNILLCNDVVWITQHGGYLYLHGCKTIQGSVGYNHGGIR